MPEQRIGTILWRGKWLIAIAVVVAVALAAFLTTRQEKVYEATAILQVNSISTPGAGGSDQLRAEEASQVLAKTYATLAVDRSFLAEIAPEISNGALSASELKRRLSAEPLEETSLIKLRLQGESPERARDLAAQVAAAFVGTIQSDANERSTQLQQQIQDRITELSTQIEQLAGEAGDTTSSERLESLRGARAALTTQLAGVVANGIQQGGSVALASPPTASSAAISPQPVLNFAAGLLLGLLVGLGLAWLRVRLDRGLHGSEEVEELLDAPVLAAIPERRRFSPEDAVLGEAYDVLRANLAFLSLDQSLHVITFTSFNPREGKTSTVEGLAYAAVRGGMQVLVIDADVRTRTLSGRLGQQDAPGLTNVIVGMSSPDEAIVEIAPGLSLLPAGPTPPNPPSLLSSGRMRDVLAQLRDNYALVIIDSPPVAHLADASILASHSDGVVVVARVGVTQRADLTMVATNLRHSPTPIVGVVILEPRTVDETYYPAMTKGRAAVTADTAAP